MQTMAKLTLLCSGAAVTFMFGGCHSDNHSTATQKTEAYYRVFAIDVLNDSDNTVIIGSKEGLGIGHFSGSKVIVDRRYTSQTATAIADTKVRSVFTVPQSNYLLVGTNEGLSVCLRSAKGEIGSCHSYTEDSVPGLAGNNVKDVVLIGSTVIAAAYHGGISTGDINATTGAIDTMALINTESSPALPQETVTSLAVNKTQDIVLVGTLNGVAVAHYDAGTKRIDSITQLSFAQSAYRFVHDIAIHPDSGRVVIASTGGITVAQLDSNGMLSEIQRYDDTTLPYRQYDTIAISSDGKKIAAGTFTKGVIVADIDAQGGLSHIKSYATKTPDTLTPDRVFSLAFSKDDAYLLVGGQSSEADIVTAIAL